MRRPAMYWSTRLGSTLFVMALLGSARSLIAQDPYIKIREPREWQDGKPFIVPPGRAVRIAGVAWHPSGVRQILINGTPVTIEPDPPLTNFEHVLTADNQPRTVTIVIVPTTSQRFEMKFAMAPPPTAAPAQPAIDSSRSPRPNVVPADTARRQPVVSQPSPIVRRSSGFKKRGWVYGLGAIAGGVLASMTTSSSAEVCETTTNGLQDCFNRTTTEANYRAAGIGLAAASIVGGILDYSISASRSRSVAATTRVGVGGGGGGGGAVVELTAETTQVGERLRLGLVRVRF